MSIETTTAMLCTSNPHSITKKGLGEVVDQPHKAYFRHQGIVVSTLGLALLPYPKALYVQACRPRFCEGIEAAVEPRVGSYSLAPKCTCRSGQRPGPLSSWPLKAYEEA